MTSGMPVSPLTLRMLLGSVVAVGAVMTYVTFVPSIALNTILLEPAKAGQLAGMTSSVELV